MNIDDKRNEFSQKLNRRINAHNRQYADDLADLAEIFQTAESQWQEDIATRRRTIADLPLLPLPSATGLGAKHPIIYQLDDLMWRDFKLDGAFSSGTMRRYPVTYCETLTEFFEAIHADDDLSDTERANILQATIAAETANPSGILGVNLPGRGCYINGWLFGKIAGTSAQAALNDPRTFPRILETACHEKLGHGFIAEMTAIGQEKTQVGLWRLDTARLFNRRTVDTPHSTELTHKHSLLFNSTKFVEEGWATWIEQFILWRASQEGLLDDTGGENTTLAPKYSWQKFKRILQATVITSPDAFKIAHALAEASQVLLVPSRPVAVETIARAMAVWETHADVLNSACAEAMGQPALYVLGYLLMKRLETRLGWQNLPYAVALAGNVTYDLANISVNDLATVLYNPRLNVDTRLAMLASLKLSPEQGPADLARLAREQFSFSVPKG